MTTSGNTSWELQSTALVNAAYRKNGYLAEDQTLGTTALANGVEALNTVVSYMVTKGMPLWKRISVTETPSATNQVYSILDAEKIAQVVLNDPNGARYPLIEKSLYDFNMLPTYSGPGVPVHYTAQPTVKEGYTVSIWPYLSDTSTIANKQIIIVYQKIFDGFFNPTDTLDFPTYWTMGIIYLTAYMLSSEVGLTKEERDDLKAMADTAIKGASDYSDEDGGFYVQPDFIGKQ